jgi:hypothetical protein
MVDTILDIVLNRRDEYRLSRIVCIQELGIGCVCPSRTDDDVFLGFGFANPAGKGLVFFLKDHFVFGGLVAKEVALNLEVAQRYRIRNGIVERLVVVCPDCAASDVFYFVGKHLSGPQVFDHHRVEVSTHGIHDDGCEVVVGADRGEEIQKRLALSKLVSIHDDFFGSIQAAFFSGIDRVFSALYIAGVIVIVVQFVGNRAVVLLDACTHFLEKTFLKSLGMRHHGIHVLVFGFEVRDDFGVFAVVEPIVIVDADVSVFCSNLKGFNCGYRCSNVRECKFGFVWGTCDTHS